MSTAGSMMPAQTRETSLPSLRVRHFGEQHVALTLSRPEVHNALDAPLVQALTEALQSLGAQVRTVLLEGTGPSFCAGADLRGWDATHGKQALQAEALSSLYAAMRRQKAIFVAKVHGIAAGGGVGLVAACDIVVAARDARFRFPEVRLGLVPAVISPYVERALGAARARYLFLTAATLSAEDAHAAGLVQKLAGSAALPEACVHVLRALWQAGPEALAQTKWLLDDIAGRPAAERAERCQRVLEQVRAGAEAQEGIRAFFAREAAAWVPR